MAMPASKYPKIGGNLSRCANTPKTHASDSAATTVVISGDECGIGAFSWCGPYGFAALVFRTLGTSEIFTRVY